MVSDDGVSADDLAAMAGRGELVGYFGYGSLVNTLTHRTRTVAWRRAWLAGFGRHWQPRPDPSAEAIALLSIRPAADHEGGMRGLLVIDRRDNLSSIDRREAGYDRLDLDRNALTFLDGGDVPAGVPLHVYQGRAPANPDRPHFILQSYLDAVLQGYLHRFGEAGVHAFMTRTAGFDTPVLADRDAPRYPRPVTMTDAERALIDEVTAGLHWIAAPIAG